MIQEIKEESLLKEYASKKSIYELSSEDIIKLMTTYLAKEIAQAFGITEKEFKSIRKQKGIPNIILENIIRDIETILNYIDSKDRYISNRIRNKIVDKLIQNFTGGLPKEEFYIRALCEINFTREKVINDLTKKNIDQEYRLNELSDILPIINRTVERLLKQEKIYLLEDNNKKLYNQLLEEKKNGKKFSKEDLTYDTLFELSIIENTPDSSIGEIFNIKKTQIRYIRQKMKLTNVLNKKMEIYPETLIYYIEKRERRNPNTSNYKYEQMLNKYTEKMYKKKNSKKTESEKQEITINIDGEEKKYHITFSNEKYSAKTQKNRNNKGTHHNYKKENETKILHGKIGEQLALEAEKARLKNIGLEFLTKEVKLVAQINEETTFDGLGYDLISFNEQLERICIEVKTSFGTKDKPFFISKKEMELIQGLKEEYKCKNCLIYYVLVDNFDITIKTIHSTDFSNLKLTPILYKVESL